VASRVVDRQREIEQLRSYAAAPPALVVLSGRRRVGKSFLLRVALTGDRVVSLQAEQKPAPLQLGDFARECSRLLPGSPPLAFADWEAAFRFVHAQAEAGGPLVVVLDEFQYLAQNTDGLDTIVQKWWDRWDHEGMPVMLVLSGSALSFMEGLLKTGTHGRSVFRPLLQPLDFRDAASFAPKAAGPIELIERYAVLGGTPQYQRWAGDRPLRDVLREVVLPTDAPLHSDPEHLIREEDEIRTAGPYFGTLEAIAGGATTPTEIGGRLALDTQLVTAHLNRLAKLGYVEKVMPVDPDGKGSARAYWRTKDPFFRFWFRFVFPQRSRLERGRVGEVAVEIERSLPGFTSFVFEDVCREWIGGVSPLGSSASRVGSWWSRRSDLEVDVAAVDRKGYTLLGSCKWWKNPVGEAVLDERYRCERRDVRNGHQVRVFGLLAHRADRVAREADTVGREQIDGLDRYELRARLAAQVDEQREDELRS